MNLSWLKEPLAVCQQSPDAPIPAWATGPAAFVSITRTGEELSVVCPARLVPKTVKQVSGWRACQVEGPLDFGLTGVLASVVTPLAHAGISIFAVATYHTDYVLVKSDQVDAATRALRAAGHTVREG